MGVTVGVGSMKLAIIPARGGSKRIPRKNIKSFYGKPIIAWSIEAALKSGCFDSVIVSTDDAEIADVAMKCGAQVPFMRPKDLADDHTGTISVIQHAIEWVVQHGRRPQHVCCIYPTAPFVSADDLQRGYRILLEAKCDYAFSVASYPYPIQRAIKINAKGGIEMFRPDLFNIRSQDLEPAWHDAGQFYWGRTDAWSEAKMLFSEGSAPVLIPRHRVQDIDTLEDWLCAEWMFEAMLGKLGST